MCGCERVSTRKASVSHTTVECCNRCIDSMGLNVERQVPTAVPSNLPSDQVTGRGVPGVDIMTKGSEELSDDFHSRIRTSRESKGWSQSDLARRINERTNVIQKAENGIRPTDTVIRKIEKMLNLKLYVVSMPKNTRMVISERSKEMTISDAGNVKQKTEKSKRAKKKGRRLGVSRSGARSRRRES